MEKEWPSSLAAEGSFSETALAAGENVACPEKRELRRCGSRPGQMEEGKGQRKGAGLVLARSAPEGEKERKS